MLNKHTYSNVTIKNRPTFSLILSVFATGTSFTILFKNLFVRMLAQVELISNATSTIKISARLIANGVLTTAVTTTMNIKGARILATIKETLIFSPVINITTGILANASQRIGTETLFHVGKLNIIASPLLGQFYLLGGFDPDTLGDDDSSTLGDMDFVAT